MSLDNILESGDSKPQNPIIANVLYKSKVLENWGRGISLMVNECRRVGLPDPEFHTDGGFVSVVFRYQNKTVGQATDQVTDQVTDQATDQVYSLIKAINTKTLSVKDIMTDLGLRHRPTFRTNYLHPALDTGCIVALFPDQPNHPKQKYHLTEKGLALLNKK